MSNRKTLYKYRDTVTFNIGVRTIVYEVNEESLHCENTPSNNIIFDLLGVNKWDLARECYGYDSSRGAWPVYKSDDFAAASRLINRLYELCEAHNFTLIKNSTKSYHCIDYEAPELCNEYNDRQREEPLVGGHVEEIPDDEKKPDRNYWRHKFAGDIMCRWIALSENCETASRMAQVAVKYADDLLNQLEKQPNSHNTKVNDE